MKIVRSILSIFSAIVLVIAALSTYASAQHEHSYGEWTAIAEKDENGQAQEARMCSVCGSTEKQSINIILGTDAGLVLIIIGTGAVLAVGAVIVAWLILRRNILTV